MSDSSTYIAPDGTEFERRTDDIVTWEGVLLQRVHTYTINGQCVDEATFLAAVQAATDDDHA